MGVQRYLELPVDNRPGPTVGVFALDPEGSPTTIERMQAVADPDPKSMQENGRTTVTFLVSFKPEFEHENCEATNDEFVGEIYTILGEGTGTSCRRSLRAILGVESDDGGK